eukprot:226709-Chlamydomonas_euryale.AAC.8
MGPTSTMHTHAPHPKAVLQGPLASAHVPWPVQLIACCEPSPTQTPTQPLHTHPPHPHTPTHAHLSKAPHQAMWCGGPRHMTARPHPRSARRRSRKSVAATHTPAAHSHWPRCRSYRSQLAP